MKIDSLFLSILFFYVNSIVESTLLLDYTLYSHLLTELEENKNEYSNVNIALNSAASNESYDHYDFSLNKKMSVNDYMRIYESKIENYNQYLYFPESERIRLKKMTRNMFEFGYDNYMKHAYPFDELDPIHCTGRGPDYLNLNNINVNDALGDYMLTLVDSLTSLVILGNSTEFKRAARLVIDNLSFDKNNTVQVFEATIRILGSLISTHLIVTDPKQPFGDMKLENYKNEFLNLANDLGVRLLSAFDNQKTHLPYPRINLKYGVPSDSYNHTCTSGAGTLILEFGMLSYLLNNPVYENVARKAMDSIFSRRNSETGLLGNELNIHTGEWLGLMSGLGAGLDSYFEYMLKSYVLFGEQNDHEKYEQVYSSIKKYLRFGRAECFNGDGHHPLFLNVNMNNGNVMNNWVDSLQASFPSVQVLNGDLDEAICFHALYFAIWKKFGILPERFNWNLKLPDVYFYPLRPEFAEATYYLYRATKNPFYLHVAKSILENIHEITKVKCGFATVHDVIDKSLEDRMESFFLSETIKYLYLTFDKENFLNNQGEAEFIFTTEGHFYPIKIAQEFKTKMNKNYKKTNRHDPSPKTRHSKKCNVKSSIKNYFSMRFNLPMKIKYFEQLFEMIGVEDNLDKLLERKVK